jgi:hypothetical protein
MNEQLAADIEIVTGSEFCVTGVKGITDAGTEFVDGFNPVLLVPDSGRVVIADAEVDGLLAQAKERGLTVETTKARV